MATDDHGKVIEGPELDRLVQQLWQQQGMRMLAAAAAAADDDGEDDEAKTEEEEEDEVTLTRFSRGLGLV